MCSDGHMPLTRDHTHTTWEIPMGKANTHPTEGRKQSRPLPTRGVASRWTSKHPHPNGSKPPGPQHCSWEPHAPKGHGGHQTSLIRLRGLAGIFASHSGMKLKPQTRKMGNYKCGNQHNPKAHQRNHKGNGKIRRKTQERAMDANFERRISPHKTGL